MADAATRVVVQHPVPVLVSPLHQLVADALLRDAAALGARWEAQARAVAPRPPGDAAARAASSGRGERVVCAVAGALADGLGGHQELVRAGWDLGSASHGSELSLHYLLKELNLLSAILLYACEQALEVAATLPGDTASAAAGMAAARRVQRTVSILTLAASKGFTAAYLDELRDQYRVLRHDLRNPLGTIRSAITFMEDESLPLERRHDPRYRAMVVRNAKSMDQLIGQRLGAERTLGPALARQQVSLHEIARAVRRDLRDDAEAHGCTIEVADGLPTRELDAVGAELALRALLVAAIRAAAPGARIVVRAEPGPGPNPLLAVVTTTDGPRREGAPPIPRDLAESIAQWSGGRVTGTCADARLEIPAVDVLDDVLDDVSRGAPVAAPATAAGASSAAGGDERQDVARAR